MEKAIYGMAMPFNDFYIDTDEVNNKYVVSKTNMESVYFDNIVGATVGHDYRRDLGTTLDNLTIAIKDSGVYFKLVPNTPLGWSIYKKVKRRAIRHCSVTYTIISSSRNLKQEDEIERNFKSVGFDDNVMVCEYQTIRVTEVCVGNHPKNELTFCTVESEDPRLTGIDWNCPALPPESILQAEAGRATFVRIKELAQEMELISTELKKVREEIRELGGRRNEKRQCNYRTGTNEGN